MTLGTCHPELKREKIQAEDFSLRFWWTLRWTVIVTVLGVAGHPCNCFHGTTRTWVEHGSADARDAYGVAGILHPRHFDSIRHREPQHVGPDRFGNGAAYLYSVAATWFREWFSGGLSQRRTLSASILKQPQ